MFWGVADRDLLLDLFEEPTGGRVTASTTSRAEYAATSPKAFSIASAPRWITSIAPAVDYDNLLFTNQVFVTRAKDTGPITPGTGTGMG